MVRRVLEADVDMKINRRCILEKAKKERMAAKSYNLCKTVIRRSVERFLKRILRDKPTMIECPSPTPREQDGIDGESFIVKCFVDAFDSDHSDVCSSISVANKDGEYPSLLAQQYGYAAPQYVSTTVDIEMALSRQTILEEVEMTTWYNLQRAIELNQERVVMRIIGKKPSLIQYSNKGRGTVFHAAAFAGEVGIIRMLVQYITANTPNPCDELARLLCIRNRNGNNPLILAIKSIKHRNMSAALYLVKLAPQAMFQLNDLDVSPLYLAVQEGYQDLLSLMIDQARVSEKIKESLCSHAMDTGLAHAAIKAQHFGVFEILMKRLPFLINSSDMTGWRPLSYAASKGYIDQVSFLLTKFPDSVSKYDRDGTMPIHKAIAGGQILIVKEFIAQCPQTLCDIDQKGRTTLYIATRYRKAEILSYLLEQKDVKKILSTRDKEGKTFQDLLEELKNRGGGDGCEKNEGKLQSIGTM